MMKEIFIVEDNQDIGYILEYFLLDEGFAVSVFHTVANFRRALNSHLPDLFLLDVVLPDGDGLNLCDEIKERNRTGHLPVLVMSANTRAEKLSSNSYADGFIKKPFHLLCV